MVKYLDYILSFPFCFYCKKYLYKYDYLCKDCFNLIEPVKEISIKVQDKYITVFALSNYNYPLKSFILAKTYSNKNASVFIARIIFKNSIINTLDFDYLVPVPLYYKREYFRGYNQAEVIAKELSFLTKKSMLKCLERTKKTEFQASLSAIMREKNVKDVFKVNSNIDIEDKIIVLVDDLMTTGSTLKNCAKELLKFKPKKIYAIVICRVSS